MGERQLVFVALALAQAAPILVLDEPTAHLDIRHQVEVMQLLVDLNERDGTTVVAVLHDLALAAHFFPRIVAMDRGAIVADGPPSIDPRRAADPRGLRRGPGARPPAGRRGMSVGESRVVEAARRGPMDAVGGFVAAVGFLTRLPFGDPRRRGGRDVDGRGRVRARRRPRRRGHRAADAARRRARPGDRRGPGGRRRRDPDRRDPPRRARRHRRRAAGPRSGPRRGGPHGPGDRARRGGRRRAGARARRGRSGLAGRDRRTGRRGRRVRRGGGRLADRRGRGRAGDAVELPPDDSGRGSPSACGRRTRPSP